MTFTVYYEFELEVEASITAGVIPITSGPADACRVGEPATAEILKIYIIDGDSRTELNHPTNALIDHCMDEVLEQR